MSMLPALLVLATAAPVPTGPARPAATAELDRNQALEFASLVVRLAEQVAAMYVREVTPAELLEGAVQELYAAVGRSVPQEVLQRLRKATGGAVVETLADIRRSLGNPHHLAGLKSLFVAVDGFQRATDPLCGLTSPRVTTFASVDQDFGIGIELDGVVARRWAVYHAENQVLSRRLPATGWLGPLLPEVTPAVPATYPWTIRRVIPGSPAQKAGIRPGDVITHLDRQLITAESAARLFPDFALMQTPPDPQTGLPRPVERALTLKRPDGTTYSVSLKTGSYTPESVFGVVRLPGDKWDCLLDRRYKIGYLRLGPIESGSDVVFAELMADLMGQGCRALILDLRWCPGGYVQPALEIAGMFAPAGAVLAKMEYRNTSRAGVSGEARNPAGGGKYAQLPLVLLVGHETTGGGELIASALRDNDDGSRCVVLGQRSAGRAMILSTLDAGFANLKYRVTTGTSYRPNGKNRQRHPDSQPTDDWGIRPDPGLEVPITPDKSAELRRQAELQALRPADSREALPFDDPNADPYRHAALVYLRKKLGLPK